MKLPKRIWLHRIEDSMSREVLGYEWHPAPVSKEEDVVYMQDELGCHRFSKGLRLRNDETLHDWCDRIAATMELGEQQRHVLHEVAKWSYIKGSNDTQEILLNEKRRNRDAKDNVQ